MSTQEDSASASSKTRQLILHLLSSQPLSVNEVAEKISMKPVAIRHHIRMLKNARAIEEWEYKRGKVGRPVIKYKATQTPLLGQTIAADTLWFYDFFQRPLSTVVRRGLLTVDKDGTILDAAEVMRDNGAGSIIVTDEERPVGIITERDIVNKVTARNLLPLDIRAERIMTNPVITIQVTAGIADAMEVMAKYKIRRLLVLKGEEAFGVVTQENIIDAFVLESGIRAFKEKPLSSQKAPPQHSELSSFLPRTSKE